MDKPLHEQFPHYYKDVRHLDYIDVYRVCDLWDVNSQPVAHAIKKLLAAGKRGAKDREKDLREAMNSIQRELEMIQEDARPIPVHATSPERLWDQAAKRVGADEQC